MSKPQFDSDGFQIVSSKKSSKNKITTVPRKETEFHKEELKLDIEKSYNRIQAAQEDLRISAYFKDIIKAVSSVLQNRKITEIVCFGLGHIGECQISRYQLALLLCLKDHFRPNKVLVHDPVFYADECKVLKQFNCTVIEENTEGNYIISTNDITLVYLPHCPKQLTNNFLWSNWGYNLKNCIFLCNSFSSLIENQPSRILKSAVPYIYKIYPYTTEVELENNFRFKDIFNDTSLHYFSSEKVDTIPSDFWLKEDKPEYENTEEFITTQMIKKLTI